MGQSPTSSSTSLKGSIRNVSGFSDLPKSHPIIEVLPVAFGIQKTHGGPGMIIAGEWYRLDDQEALRQVPKKAGVYELADADGIVIYIGRAKGGNLRNRLRTHAREKVNECIRRGAVHFRFVVTKAHRRDEKALFTEYKAAHDGEIPHCNTIDPSLRR